MPTVRTLVRWAGQVHECHKFFALFSGCPSDETLGLPWHSFQNDGIRVVIRKQIPHLRLHQAEQELTSPTDVDPIAAMLDAFSDATGWQVQCLAAGTATNPQASQAMLSQQFGWTGDELAKRVRLVSNLPLDGLLDESDFFEQTTTSEQSAWTLLESMNDLVARLKQCEEALVRQEGELAAGLSVTLSDETSEEALHLSMEEALQRAMVHSGSDAAAVYLLDDATSTLKMRSCIGLDKSNLAKPPRSLRGALADLEALLGNAVLLENVAIAPDWNCPEAYAAGLCVPIGSSHMPHGTLWLWSDHVRDFSAADLEAAKSAADKILADIERRVLSSEVLRVRGAAQQLEAASLMQASLIPDEQPLHHDYDISGFSHHTHALGGSFHTWNVNSLEQITAAIGVAVNSGAAGALAVARLQTIVDMAEMRKRSPADVLRKANDMVWQLQDSEWRCSLAMALIEPETGNLQLSLGGSIGAFVVGQRGYRPLPASGPLLGLQPDSSYKSLQIVLEPGDILVLLPNSLLSKSGIGLNQEGLLSMLHKRHDEPLNDLAADIAQQLPLNQQRQSIDDQSLLLLRRKL